MSFERSSTKPAAQQHAAPQASSETSIYNSTLDAHDRQPDSLSQASSNLHNTTAEKRVPNGPAGIGAAGQAKANTSATLVQPFSQITLEVPLDENNAARHAIRSQQPTSASGPAIAGAAENADRQDVKRKRREQQRKNPNPPKPALPVTQSSVPNGRTHRGTQGKRHRRRMEHNGVDDQNGWATGEVSDLHDMGDFDFEENLSKFDKQKVFDQIKLDDTTADEDRLHTFNRRPRPGTAGGKNLHYSENVLDSPRPIHREHSSADDEIENPGNPTLNRSARKLPSKRIPSRQGSGIASAEGFMTGSGMLRSSSVRSWSKSPHDSAEHLSPVIRRDSARQTQRHFTLADSDSYCPCLSPIQMLELEHLATSEFGLSDDMLTENAARCIAESAISLTYESLPVSSKGGLFYVFAGNTKTGARAIAAARHLLNRQIRVVVCLLQSRKEADLLEPVRRQLKMYSDCKGRLTSLNTMIVRSKDKGEHVDVVVDALLGMHLSFQDLRPSEQKTFSMLATWLNNVRNERPTRDDFRILSLDVPSGVDASTGMWSVSLGYWVVSLLIACLGASPELFNDLEELQHVDLILSLGAPKTGLLTSWVTETPEWPGRLSIADIGIPNAAWRRFGSSNRRGIDFGSQWVARIEYHGE